MGTLSAPFGPFQVLIQDAEKERERWQELRKITGISASKVPILLGLSPFDSPLGIWAWYRGLREDAVETDQMWWGSKLQDIVAQRIAEDENLIYLRDERLLQSTKNPLLLATPDGWYFQGQEPELEDALAEIKTAKSMQYWDNGVPAYVVAQVQAQLYVTGRQRCRVGVFFREEASHFWDWVERDDAFIDMVMIPGIERFWKMVQDGVPPETDNLEETCDAIKSIWPNALDGLTVEIPGDLEEVDDRLVAVKEEIKGLISEKRGLDNRLKAAIGQAEIGYIEGTDDGYSYKNQSREGYTVDPTSYRVLKRVRRK